MSGWAAIFLGVIAVSTLVTAILQVAALIAAARLARRVERVIDRAERELTPLFGYLTAIGRDTSRAASLAAAQVERADRVLADLVQRLEQTIDTFRAAVGGTAREGAAVLAGIRAALAAIRDARGGRARHRADEEDGLFI